MVRRSKRVRGDDNEIYPNSPLVNVTCEITFPGNPAVECRRDTFWKKIRTRYPNFLVPAAEVGKPVALQPYRFQNPESGRTVSVALNSFALTETKILRHKFFIAEFTRLSKAFHSCFRDIDTVTRIGWRYINVIPFSRENGVVPVKQFLRASAELNGDMLESARTFDVRASRDIGSATVIVRLAVIGREGEGQQEALLLDIDYGCEKEKLRFAEAVKWVSAARSHNRRFFEDVITDDYREYLRGKTL
ncbi:MAG: TIGR04255 family protein [Gammaproteobacteria bacterium]